MRPRVISQSLARRAEGTRAETKPGKSLHPGRHGRSPSTYTAIQTPHFSKSTIYSLPRPLADCLARQFAAAAYQRPLEAPEPPLSDTPASALPPSSSSSSSSSSSLRALEPTTPASAQSYLSDLLHLPPSHAFPQDLALQILTHKSYRYAHLIRSPHSVRRRSISPASDEEAGPSSVSHNARLSFLGRRAISTYLALFLHSHLRTDRGLRSADFLRGRALDEKLKAMTHVNNLGREVGSRWGVGDVMRWDRNEVSCKAFIKTCQIGRIWGNGASQAVKNKVDIV